MMESVDPETGEFYTEIRPELRICGHCCEVMRGYASLGDTWLCHPDDGLDCYTAVTLHKHGMRCTICFPNLAYSSTWAEVKARLLEKFPDRSLDFDCENCGTNLNIAANTIYGTCRAGRCSTFLCRDCGNEWGAAGSVNCACQRRDPKLSKIRKLWRGKRKGKR